MMRGVAWLGAFVWMCGATASSHSQLASHSEARAGSARSDGGRAAAPAGGAAKATPLLRSRTTVSGQPLKLPQGEAELVATAVDIPRGGRLPTHQHPWSRFVYVERGSIRVLNRDTGVATVLTRGQVLPEAVGQWHEATALGRKGVRLIVIDLVPPGATNLVPAPG
jgi:quercetin dioxygenase-like cupin family protein